MFCFASLDLTFSEKRQANNQHKWEDGKLERHRLDWYGSVPSVCQVLVLCLNLLRSEQESPCSSTHRPQEGRKDEGPYQQPSLLPPCSECLPANVHAVPHDQVVGDLHHRGYCRWQCHLSLLQNVCLWGSLERSGKESLAGNCSEFVFISQGRGPSPCHSLSSCRPCRTRSRSNANSQRKKQRLRPSVQCLPTPSNQRCRN